MLHLERQIGSILVDTFRRLVQPLVVPFVPDAWPLPPLPWPPTLILTPETAISLWSTVFVQLQSTKRLDEKAQEEGIFVVIVVSPASLFREKAALGTRTRAPPLSYTRFSEEDGGGMALL